ncbi:unnamed protein product [Phytophthora fragariaefolia]|uniref:Unnamed protein product n=1 Tax=Phytophthora fragariaefolia TaxID=1490495 RepID=A0A9W7CZH3_9STRA|nr:unnamed protein product [Phytophthora fragariaefolia]
MSPNRGQGDSTEAQQSSDESTADEEAEQPTEVKNISIMNAGDSGRRLADILGGYELLILLIEDSHRRLVDRVRRQNARDQSIQNRPLSVPALEPNQTTEPTPTTEKAPPAAPSAAAPAPSKPSEPTEPSEQGGARPPDDVRSRAFSHGMSMLDNQFGQRYDDAELIKHPEKLMGKEVPLPKLTGKKEEYARWKSEVTLRFPSFALNSITYGEELNNSALGYTSMK